MEAPAGADEGVDARYPGRVCEGSGYNVAVVHSGSSAPAGRHPEGITRQTLLEICARDGIQPMSATFLV
jgi:branched-subunit amino acid aminotransferase/4-amino-4-deoxychorismate lyase